MKKVKIGFVGFRFLVLMVMVFLPLLVLAQDEEILPDLNEEIVQIPIVVDGHHLLSSRHTFQ